MFFSFLNLDRSKFIFVKISLVTYILSLTGRLLFDKNRGPSQLSFTTFPGVTIGDVTQTWSPRLKSLPRPPWCKRDRTITRVTLLKRLFLPKVNRDGSTHQDRVERDHTSSMREMGDWEVARVFKLTTVSLISRHRNPSFLCVQGLLCRGGTGRRGGCR